MSKLSLHLPPPPPSLTLRTWLFPHTPKRNTKLQICVENAYAAQASRGEACWNGQEPCWALGSFRSQRRGLLLDPETGALPLPSHWLSAFTPGQGEQTHLLTAAAARLLALRRAEAGQTRSNTLPNSRSGLPQGSRKIHRPGFQSCSPPPRPQLLCHLSSMKCR